MGSLTGAVTSARLVAGKGRNEKNTVDQPLDINVYFSLLYVDVELSFFIVD